MLALLLQIQLEPDPVQRGIIVSLNILFLKVAHEQQPRFLLWHAKISCKKG
jgi:hypothetical protein